MIRTIWMKAIYIIILTVAVLFSVLYLGDFSILLLCVLLIIPIFLWLSLWYIKFCLNISIKSSTVLYHRNKPHTLNIVIENNGFLPVSKASALVIFSSVTTNKKIPISISFPIPARNVTTVKLTVIIPHCGLTEVNLKHLEFTDYIRLFRRKLRKVHSSSILTLPSGTELKYKIKIPYSITDKDSNVYSKFRAGDDPSEIYRIREYQLGDMQKRIHWKLSSRTDTIWVKEYSLPIKQRVSILIDYSITDEVTADLVDAALEAAYTFSNALINQEISIVIYWISMKSQKLVWNEIHSTSDLNDCFTMLLSYPPNKDAKELIEQASDILDLHSNNVVYYCTPRFNLQEIKKYYGSFQSDHLYVMTSGSCSKHDFSNENIIFIKEDSISKDLKKLSSMEVTFK